MSPLFKTSEQTISVLIVRIGRDNFGVKASIIKEVVPIMSIQRFPDMPDFLEGFIDIRGALYAVVDLSRQFGEQRKQYFSANRIILMNCQARDIGFIVDEIERMEEWHPGTYQEGMLAENSDQVFSGEIGQTDSGNVPVLNLDSVLSNEQISRLSTRGGTHE